jgi:hypothetical protein
VAQLMGDGEASALGTGLAVVEDAPLGGVLRVAHQHAFAAVDVEHHRGFDLPNARPVGRGRQHLPDDFQIDSVGHAFGVPRSQPLLDGVGGNGTCEGLRCAQSSAPAFALVGEHDLERLPVAILFLVRHPRVLAEEGHVLQGWLGEPALQ